MSETAKRVTLTKAELATEHGQKLIALLIRITADGMIEGREVIELYAELKALPQEIAGVRHLIATVEDIMADGVVTDDERTVLWRQFERVLPADERAKLTEMRKAAEGAEKEQMRLEREAAASKRAAEKALSDAQRQSERERRENAPPLWHSDPPSDAQLSYIRSLGRDPFSVRTKGEASALIDSIVRSPDSFTPRQKMVLRFWNVTPPSGWGKRDVSEWMDTWYAEDPDHLRAWEAFKDASGDTGTQTDPMRVPVGIGVKWLAHIKGTAEAPRSEAPPIPRYDQKPPMIPMPEGSFVTTSPASTAGTGVLSVILLTTLGAVMLIGLLALTLSRTGR